MIKYTATQTMKPNMSSRWAENLADDDMSIPMFMTIVVVLLIGVCYTVQRWENANKTFPVNTEDSCFSTSVRINGVERYKQTLTPIRRSRSRDSVDSIV